MFDHHCPFVGTSVGLYNYKYFYGFLATSTLYLFVYSIVFTIYQYRSTNPDSLLFWVGILLALHIFFPGGMLLYHTQLVHANLTTNEHMNVGKYDYLWEAVASGRRFYNPWDHHSFSLNLMDRIAPSDKCYLLPEQQRQQNVQMVPLVQHLGHDTV